MVQRRHGPHFTLETVAEPLGGDLDGHVAAHARIVGAVHLAHSTYPDLTEDRVRTQISASRQSHSSSSDSISPNGQTLAEGVNETQAASVEVAALVPPGGESRSSYLSEPFAE